MYPTNKFFPALFFLCALLHPLYTQAAEELKPSKGAGEVFVTPNIELDKVEILDNGEDFTLPDKDTDPEEKTVTKQKEKQQQQEISLQNIDSIGIIEEKNGGVKATYWGTRTYKDILEILKNMDISTRSRAYNETLSNILLSSTNIPPPENIKDAGSIIKIRIDKLVQAGRFSEATQLIERLPAPLRSETYKKILVKMALVDFNNSIVCDTVKSLNTLEKQSPFWLITDIVCSTIANKGQEVEAKLKNIAGQGVTLPSGLNALIEYAIHKKDISDTTIVDVNVWSLNLMRLTGFGITIPDNTKDIFVRRGLLLNAGVDSYDRVVLAEDMFAHSAIEGKTLFAVYASVPENYMYSFDTGTIERRNTQEIVPHSTKKDSFLTLSRKYKAKMPLPFLRMKTMKAIRQKDDVKDKLSLLSDVLWVTKDYKQKILTLYIFAPLFEDIEPLRGIEGIRIARMFYGVGNIYKAKKWAEENATALWFEKMLTKPLPTQKSPIQFVSKRQNSSRAEEKVVTRKEKGSQIPVPSPRQNASGIVSKNSEQQSVENAKPQSISIPPAKIGKDDNTISKNSKERQDWIAYVKRTYAQSQKNNQAGIYMAQAFLTLEALGYKIPNADWVQASQNSAFAVARIFSPAKVRALQIFTETVTDPISVLLHVRQFVNLPDIDDRSFAHVLKALYRAGYGPLAKRLTLERLVYGIW